MKFFSAKLVALLSVSLVVSSAPAISANIPAITKSFSKINPVYVGLLATIPSLFIIIGVFVTSTFERLVGRKNTIIIGLIIVGTFGTLPAWYRGSFMLLFLSRCLLGLGIGLFNRLLIQMLSEIFQNDNHKKAKALGLESACEGLGGILMTLAVGQLVKINWESSFLVYGVAIVSLIFVVLFIPDQKLPKEVTKERITSSSLSKERKVKSILLGFILFCIVLLFINYNLQITPLLIEQGIGDATNGSNMIAVIATGAFVAGNLFGFIYNRLGRCLLPCATVLAGISICFTTISTSIFFTLICSLVLGFSFRNIMPYFMHTFTTGGKDVAKFGTIVVLVAYNLGATIAPYVSRFISILSESGRANNQLIITGLSIVLIGMLTLLFNKYMTI